MYCKISLDKIAKHLAFSESLRSSFLDKHVARCKDCALKAESLEKLGELLDGVEMAIPPEGTWSKIQPRLVPRTQRKPAAFTVRRFAFTFVCLVLAMFVILQIRPESADSEDITLFYKRHSSVAPAAAGGIRPASLITRLEKDPELPIHIPSYLAGGWSLKNVDRFHCRRGLPVEQIIYANAEKKISVFIKPCQGGPGYGMGSGRGFGRGRGTDGGQGQCQGTCRMFHNNGMSMAMAHREGRRYFVVGDIPEKALATIAEELSAQDAKEKKSN